jgi:hypothetical protein
MDNILGFDRSRHRFTFRTSKNPIMKENYIQSEGKFREFMKFEKLLVFVHDQEHDYDNY